MLKLHECFSKKFHILREERKKHYIILIMNDNNDNYRYCLNMFKSLLNFLAHFP